MIVEHIGDATLYLADCREVDLQGAVVATDPPYGMSYVSTRSGSAPWAKKKIAGDGDVDLRDAVIGAWEGPFAVFGRWDIPPPPGTRSALVWDKGGVAGMGDLQFPWKMSFEMVFIGGQGWAGHRGEGVIKGCYAAPNEVAGRTHPTEKPTSVWDRILSKAPPGVVIDPFMGTGSTGVSALGLGRPFLGVELDPEYFEMACLRIAAVAAQGRLFA